MMGTRRAGLAVAACALFWAACGEPRSTEVPENLIGSWTTSHAKYSDSGFEIHADRVVIHTGVERFSVHPIRSFKEDRDEEGRIRYSLVYTADGEPADLVLYLSSPGVAWLRNQPEVVWRREGSGDDPSSTPADEGG